MFYIFLELLLIISIININLFFSYLVREQKIGNIFTRALLFVVHLMKYTTNTSLFI